MSAGVPDAAPAGRGIIRAATAGTAVFVATAIGAALGPGALGTVAAAVALVLFAIGILVFFAAYAGAVARSRTHVVSVLGVYFLAGCAPRSIQLRLLGLLGVQIGVAVVTASVRPFSSLAYGILVPMFGIACAGLWGAYHGAFPERPQPRDTLSADD